MRKHKYFLVYRTTNIITGSFYIGMHACNDLNDGYLGSGLRLKHSVKKYGKHNFRRRILKFCASREQMIYWEKKYVAKYLGRPLCLNLAEGGHGGWSVVRNDPLLEAKRKARASSEATRKKAVATMKSNPNYAENVTAKNRRVWCGRKHKPETRDKMSEWHIGKWVGERSAHFGKCWICHDEAQLTMRVMRSEVADYLDKGWRAGRVMCYQHVRDYLLELP